MLSQQLALELLSGKYLQGGREDLRLGLFTGVKKKELLDFCGPGERREGAEKVAVMMKRGIREARKARVWVPYGISLLEEILKVLIPTTKMVTVCGDGC